MGPTVLLEGACTSEQASSWCLKVVCVSKKKIFFFQIFIVIFNSNFELYFHFQLDQNIF